MATSPLRRVVDQLRCVAYLQAGAALKDEDLLEAFLARRDDAAFETLVRRHGPMVMGVCRRVLRDRHHAEDAFQATFMVLIRKAASLSKRERLVKWLYGVANRTALQAKKQAARRRAKESVAMSQSKTSRDEPTDELLAHLDEELSRLPDKYRVPIILCDLEGKTRKGAAAQLGVPEGTLSTRLMRGREALAKRMKRHGTTLSGSALAVALSQKSMAAVPPGLVAATVKAGSLLSAGKGVAGVIRVTVASLTEGVVKTMLLGKLKKLAVVVFVTAVAATVGNLTFQHTARASILADANARPNHDEAVASAAPGPNGKPLAAASENKTIKLRATLTGHTYGVMSIAFSPDGKALASGSFDQTIKLWDAATGKEKAALRGHFLQRFSQVFRSFSVNSVAYSPDGTILASGSSDHTIKLWDTLTGNEIRALTGHDDEVHAVAFSPDGRTLATASENEVIKLWNAASGKEEATFKESFAGPLRIWSLAFSPDGKTLATAHHYPVIKLWDVATAKSIATLKGHTSIVAAAAYSPDGKTLASASYDNTIKLWDTASGKEIATLNGHASDVNSVAFSPDGKTLASGSFDKTVRLWDVATGGELATIAAHQNRVNSVAFSPDGKTLASASLDKTIKLWDVPTVAKAITNANRASQQQPKEVNNTTVSSHFELKKIDLANLTLHGWTLTTNPERTTFSGGSPLQLLASSDTKIFIDGKEAKFADLETVRPPGDDGQMPILDCEYRLLTKPKDGIQKASALRIEAKGRQMNAVLEKIDAGKNSITPSLLWAGFAFEPAEVKEIDSDAKAVEHDVVKEAPISIDGRDSELGRLKPGMYVRLYMSAVKKNCVIGIWAFGAKVEARVISVDTTRSTISVHVPRVQLASQAVPVAKDADILLAGAPAKLSELQPGMRVTLQMSAARDESLIVGITAEKAKKE